MRRDLPAAQIAVQAAHAAAEAARHFLPPDRDHPHLVLCRVSSGDELLRAAHRLDRLGVRFTLFREPDRGGEATALATEPLAPGRRGVLGRYSCLTRADLLAAPEPEAGPRGPAAAAPDGWFPGGCAMT